MGPDVGEGWSGMSTHHAVTRSVRDSAALLDAVAGAGLGAPYFPPPAERPFLAEVGRPPMTLRIAFTTEAFNGVKTDPECVRATEAAASLCRELGHEVVEGSPSLDNERLAAATPVIAGANVLATLQDRAAQLGRDLQSSDVEPGTWELVKGLFGRGPGGLCPCHSRAPRYGSSSSFLLRRVRPLALAYHGGSAAQARRALPIAPQSRGVCC